MIRKVLVLVQVQLEEQNIQLQWPYLGVLILN